MCAISCGGFRSYGLVTLSNESSCSRSTAISSESNFLKVTVMLFAVLTITQAIHEQTCNTIEDYGSVGSYLRMKCSLSRIDLVDEFGNIPIEYSLGY